MIIIPINKYFLPSGNGCGACGLFLESPSDNYLETLATSQPPVLSPQDDRAPDVSSSFVVVVVCVITLLSCPSVGPNTFRASMQQRSARGGAQFFSEPGAAVKTEVAMLHPAELTEYCGKCTSRVRLKLETIIVLEP